MKKRPFRYIWTILIFLLLGAILNVAVAWGGLCWQHYWASRMSKPYLTDRSQIPQRCRDFYDQVCPTELRHSSVPTGYTFDSRLSTTHNIGTLAKHVPLLPVHGFDLMILEVGIPYRSLWGYSSVAWKNSTQPPTPSGRGYVIDRYSGPTGLHFVYEVPLIKGVHLPYLFLWSGFIINSLFYAVILWLFYQGFFTLRRHRRIRRGRCGQCGYLVAPNLGVPGASPNCPECGTPIAPAPGSPPAPRITNPEIV